MREPAIIAVAGSCVTRDNFNSRFNPDYKRFFSVELSTNQTSMITLMSDPIEPVFEPVSAMSDYDRWNVHSDLSREFLPLVVEVQPDYLIVDFFADVHFGVLRQDDGRYLTDNPWKLRHTDYYQERERTGSFTRLQFTDDEDDYFALWSEAMDRFAAYVAEHCPETVVIVNYGFNTDSVLVPDKQVPIPMRRHRSLYRLDVPRANAFWSRLDDHAVRSYGWESIDLRAERYSSFAEHPWGPFYVHYTPDYYHRFMAELHKIHLRRTSNSDLLDRLAHIERAAREHGERQTAIHDAVVADQLERLSRQRQRIQRQQSRLDLQKARITELESFGPIRAARFALGHRLRKAKVRRSSAD